jgi:hypothetical protein
MGGNATERRTPPHFLVVPVAHDARGCALSKSIDAGGETGQLAGGGVPVQNAFSYRPVQLGLGQPKGGNGRFLVAARDRRLDFFDKGAHPAHPGAVDEGPLLGLPNALFRRFVPSHRSVVVVAGRAYIRPAPVSSIRLAERGDGPPDAGGRNSLCGLRAGSISLISAPAGKALRLAARGVARHRFARHRRALCSRWATRRPVLIAAEGAASSFAWRRPVTPAPGGGGSCCSLSGPYKINAGGEMTDAERDRGGAPRIWREMRSPHSGVR